MTPHLPNMLAFLDILSKDVNLTDTVLSASCGLIGDLVSCFGGQLAVAFENDAIQNILIRGKKSKNQRTKTLANWATKEIRKLKNL